MFDDIFLMEKAGDILKYPKNRYVYNISNN